MQSLRSVTSIKYAIAGLFLASAPSLAADPLKVSAKLAAEGATAPKACAGYGPQTPRDIDQLSGSNSVIFPQAPPATEMNLCNIHFHKNAEHKAAAFSIYAGDDASNGQSKGFQCQISKTLTDAELAPFSGDVCGGVKPGDTIEMHWVHSSCDVAPGPGLGSCLSDQCANPSLRVETQVFTVVNDPSAMNFDDFRYGGEVNGYHQAKAIPNTTGAPVQFAGSTTGPSYTEQSCSPLQVSWSVRPQCAKVDIASLAKFCESNVFKEDHAHGIRRLVTNPALLSEIK